MRVNLSKTLFRTILWILIAVSAGLFGDTVYKNAAVSGTSHRDLPELSLPAQTLALTVEPDEGTAPLSSLLAQASRSIDIVMYDFTDTAIEQALADASSRGIAVRVLLDHGYYGQPDKKNDAAYAYFQKMHVPVQWTPSYFALTHQKTAVIDKTTAYIMTFNLTPKYYATGRDFGITDTDPADVNAIEKTFEADWSKQQIAPQYGDALVWSPGSENDLVSLIQRAHDTLDVYNEEMADKTIIAALQDAAARGVSVRVIMTNAGNWRTAFVDLRKSGVSIRTYSGAHALYIHAKMIVADASYGFLGSENFSANSLLKNRELGIFIEDPSVLSSLEATFAKDWNGGKQF